MSSITNLKNLTRPKSYITGKINVKEDGPYNIRIINSYEDYIKKEGLKGEENYSNEKEFKQSIKIKIGDELFDFHYNHEFIKGGTYTIEYWITNKLTKINYMFAHCKSLITLNLSNFDTQNVSDMSWMFFGCKSLKELNLSDFKTNKVTNMEGMFYQCLALENLNISNY